MSKVGAEHFLGPRGRHVICTACLAGAVRTWRIRVLTPVSFITEFKCLGKCCCSRRAAAAAVRNDCA